MKTLILASNGGFVTEHASDYLPKPLSESKIAHIITASKSVPDTSYLEDHRSKMRELNWNFETVDIEGMNEEEILKTLGDKDVVHVEGGNTFYLLKCIRESGFKNAIEKLISKGVAYIGTSAGSYVACPTIEMAVWKKPKFDQHGVTDFTAMNLVPFLVSVHYDPENKELLEKKIKETEYPVKILADGQAILVQDGEAKFVGEGEEIKL